MTLTRRACDSDSTKMTRTHHWYFSVVILFPIRDRIVFFAIQSYPALKNWYTYPIRILFWLKSYHLYPKTIRKRIMMHNIHFCVVSNLPYEAKYLLKLFFRQLNTVGWSSHMTSLERMSYLVDHDICSSSLPAAWASVVMVSGLASS